MGEPGRPESADVLGGYSPVARRVLDVVESIPPGYVLTYGDVAELAGLRSGRVVGNVLHRYGREVPWWRVVLASGRPAPPHPEDALERLRAEGVSLTAGGERVSLAVARWDVQSA